MQHIACVPSGCLHIGGWAGVGICSVQYGTSVNHAVVVQFNRELNKLLLETDMILLQKGGEPEQSNPTELNLPPPPPPQTWKYS